ncbi:MAG: Sugar (pentulose or hexulose) kinase [Chloroflexi bacterium AL-W]|nr:Sugar (pentulose or hexulose) kinase [Chloroflexi bacterium AL-N1]NOK65548.1 Sugar (pentulose or hexulose) kinase [Chloroflexi bacterium AL-N10]NOK74510.1 Sugar (pentulose or hexulose) kinase [Chloroflexi bacterium AL-N5]NOK80581.1 Sugar (pentulose or hexulose) kinase [Chloroflexi bacterium AL-W]NOK88768.1 Sugar (pentulose or hexulose) kinase [Chloroflexi bacterium AL-N15]
MPPVARQHAEAPFIVTIDVGSSSVRVLLFDRLGRHISDIGAQERCAIPTQADGAAQEDVGVLLARIEHCLDAVLASVDKLGAAIAGVAVATFVSNLLALDAVGEPLTPLITYADTRNSADAAALRRSLDEESIHERTGCLLRTSYWPARLAWLQRTQPEVWQTVARWITLGEYLELKLFGESRVSYSAASWSGLLNRRELIWDTSLLEALEMTPEQFGPLVDVGNSLCGLREPYATRWPALRNVPWFPAIGDGAAANIGSGCADPSRMALTVGTTGALRLVLPEVPRVPKGLWCYRVDQRRMLLGGATSEGGNVYAWMAQTLQLPDAATIEHELAHRPPDGHGLTVLPFVAGERSPGWAGDVQATISGITSSTTPLDILQAGLEAVAYRFGLIERSIRAQHSGEYQVVASGGALLSSPAWMQIIANVIGRPVVSSAEPEATSRGVALLALEALNLLALADMPVADSTVYEPDPVSHARYQEAITRQERLYDAVVGAERQSD